MTDQETTSLGMAGVPQDASKRLEELQPGKAGAIFTSRTSRNSFTDRSEVKIAPACQ